MCFPKSFAALPAFAIVAALSACMSAPIAEDNATRQAATAIRVATPITEPAAFVRESRPQQTTYLPVGVTPPQRAIQPRAPAGTAALEAELDAQRRASQNFARRPAPRPTYDGSRPPRVQPPPKELTPQ
jgi:hypothetical protein